MILTPAEVICDLTARGIWSRVTVDDIFRAAVIGGGDRLAIVDAPDKPVFAGMAPLRLNWRELDDWVERLCVRLIECGLAKDDVVGVQLPNTVELAVVYLAAARLGLIVTPFPIQYREHELADLLDFAGARLFISGRAIKGHDHAAMIEALRPRLPKLGRILAWAGAASPGIESLDGLADTPIDRVAVADVSKRSAIDANDVYTVTWTSGTESRPKGVARSHNQWLCAGLGCAEAGELDDGGVLLNPFPMVHIGSLGGMFFPWLIKRGILVQHQPFDLEVFLGQIAAERVTYTVAPPAVLNLLLQNEALMRKHDLSSLKSVGSGSAPLSPWMVRGFQEKHGISIWHVFGSSEGCGLFGGVRDIPDPEARAAFLPRFGVPGLKWPAWVSRVQQTRLVDPETERAITEPGVPGELRIKGGLLFSGYWNNPELTLRSMDAEGYYRTGDIFEIAGEGPVPRYYHYLARRREIINRGGEKISPAEIESLIDGHPAVREAAVIAVPDARMGEKVCAVVALRDGKSLDLETLNQFLRDKKIAVYKLPEQLEIVAALPRNPVGKVQKHELTARLAV